MVVKVKEIVEKTKHVENNDKSRKYILRGQRNARYHERILSNKKKSNILTYFYRFSFIFNSLYLYNFTYSSVQKGI